MPKLNKPVMGKRAENIIKEIAQALSKKPDDYGYNPERNDAIDVEAKGLLSSINNDTCCDGGQEKKIGMSLVIPSKNCVEIDRITVLINSFRLNCHDCLNPDCKHRDPDFPIEDVQERAKQFEESEE